VFHIVVDLIILMGKDSRFSTKLVDEIADKAGHGLKDSEFNQTPPASITAQKERQTIPERPENSYIKLKP